MGWSVINPVLGRTGDHPSGSNAHGYDIGAPLDPDGHLDEAAWQEDI